MDTDRPRASRTAEGRIIAGVAAGLAGHIKQPVLGVRIAFVAATALHGIGIGIYLGLWIFLPIAGKTARADPSAHASDKASHSRQSDNVQAVALAVMAVGAVVLLQFTGSGLNLAVLVPLAVAAMGVFLVWRQFDDQRSGNGVAAQKSFGAVIRIILGTFLVGFAAVYLISSQRSFGQSMSLLVTVAAALVGMGLVLGPWIIRLVGDLAAERRERIRTQERADVAAHLHDSVLQTLALLQKNSDDPGSVATLARRQERELREWLYGGTSANSPASGQTQTLAAALTTAAGEVEQDHHVAIEVVTVSDTPLDDAVSAVLLAARESMVNAAKHSGADRIDVYAEVSPDQAEVFIRDRGCGFDSTNVRLDRMGVRGSIVDRMKRHGGEAEIRSSLGEGTSIRLAMPLAQTASAENSIGRVS